MKKIISIIITCSLILTSCGKNNELPIERPFQVVDLVDNDLPETIDDTTDAEEDVDIPEPTPTPIPKPTPTKTPEPSLTPVPSSTVEATLSMSKSPEPSKIPTSKPSVKPSATATPEPSKNPEKTNDKYSYFRIACVVVAVIVAIVLMVKMVKRCKGKEVKNGNKIDVIANLQAIMASPGHNRVAVARAIISIAQQGKMNLLLGDIKQSAYEQCFGFFDLKLYSANFNKSFKTCVKAINILGRLEEVRTRVISECTRRGLDLDEILAEQQP
jgi:hypothetical protein